MFNQEDVLIPFNTSPLPSGPWIIVAPHADDETFGMGGTLLKAKQQGIETHQSILALDPCTVGQNLIELFIPALT